jgi:anti-sigma B factor antagonist
MSDLLQVVRDEDSHRVQLIGELDASNAESLVQDLAPQLVGGATVTLDLSGLSFIDSMGLRSLLRIAAALDRGGRLVLHQPQPAVARTFELVGLEKVDNIELVSSPAN